MLIVLLFMSYSMSDHSHLSYSAFYIFRCVNCFVCDSFTDNSGCYFNDSRQVTQMFGKIFISLGRS